MTICTTTDHATGPLSIPLAYASFTISGDAVAPHFWTRYFCYGPDIAVAKGDLINDPTGQRRILTRRTGVWGIRSKGKVETESLEPHLRFLIARLQFPRADFREEIMQQRATARFFCYWRHGLGDRMPDVPDDIRRIANAMGVDIEIDEYR